MRKLLAVLMVLLPASLRRHVARVGLGWDIHPTAHIGRSLLLVRHVSMGPGSSIGALNVFRGLDELRLGEGASIASRNWVVTPPYAAAAFTSTTRRPALILGDYAMITIGHEIDCSDRVEFAAHARFAGFRSQILTHSLNLMQDTWVTGPVELGEHCAVMSGCILLSGTRVPARSIVSAGSVITTKLTKEQMFYRGNPAEAVRELPSNLKYFKIADANPGRGA